MSQHDELDDLIGRVERNEVPGGSLYGRTIARIVQLRLAACRGATVDDARRVLADAARWAVATKPSMASVRNVADLARATFDGHASNGEATADPAIAAVDAALDAYVARSAEAIERLADHIGSVITAGARILVHSNSGSLARVLHRAAIDIPDVSLLVTESRPYRESRALVAPLAATAMPVTLYADAAVAIAAAAADVALVGADSVLADGTLVNKMGTTPLALACREAGVPVYGVLELSKVYLGAPGDVTMEVRPGAELAADWDLATSGRVAVWNQFFEPTPPALLAGYVTEIGVVAPHDVARAAAVDQRSATTNHPTQESPCQP